jgi:hypothetical protein
MEAEETGVPDEIGIAHERAFIGPLSKGCNEFGRDCGRGAGMAGLHAAFATRPHDAGAVAGAMAPDTDRAQEICVLATRNPLSRPGQQEATGACGQRFATPRSTDRQTSPVTGHLTGYCVAPRNPSNTPSKTVIFSDCGSAGC